MPAPEYIGDTTWTRDPGAASGITGTTVFYDIPYSGELGAEATAFRAAWPKGSPCPIAGFTQLRLVSGPTIQELEGGKGTSTLRFEGVDTSGDFGDPDPVVTAFHWDPVEIELYEPGTWACRYSYKKSVAVVTYTRTSKAGSPGSAPSLDTPVMDRKVYDYYVEDGLENEKGATQSAPQASAISGPGSLYTVDTVSRFNRITDLGTGIFEHEEWHERILEAPPPPAP